MRILILLVTIVLFASVASAAPYVVCDPYPDAAKPTYFKVVVDSKPAVNVNYALHSSGAAIVYDVAGVDANAHNLIISACNERGCSSTVNFTIPSVPSVLLKVRLLQ